MKNGAFSVILTDTKVQPLSNAPSVQCGENKNVFGITVLSSIQENLNKHENMRCKDIKMAFAFLFLKNKALCYYSVFSLSLFSFRLKP